jgi:hypothetical protein
MKFVCRADLLARKQEVDMAVQVTKLQVTSYKLIDYFCKVVSNIYVILSGKFKVSFQNGLETLRILSKIKQS